MSRKCAAFGGARSATAGRPPRKARRLFPEVFRTSPIGIERSLCDLSSQFYFFQVAGLSISSMGKISNRPASISNISTSFESTE